MISNSDGLSPSLRPQLGVGWNRALPAPFGFDNGIFPDGVNDYLTTRDNLNIPLSATSVFTVEFWMDFDIISGYRPVVNLIYADTNRVRFGVTADQFRIDKTPAFTPARNAIANNRATALTKCHVVLSMFGNSAKIWLNGIQSTITYQLTGAFMYDGIIIRRIEVIGEPGGGFTGRPVDEVRMYNRALTQSEIDLNYNAGMGANPCVTEFLEAWYQFQVFENLDFSEFQDGSDIRLGLRDMSGKNRHVQPMNIDTNPASPGYVLKPF